MAPIISCISQVTDQSRNGHVSLSKLLILGMVIPPLIGNPNNGYINPYEIRLMSLSLRKTMGVDRPDRTHVVEFPDKQSTWTISNPRGLSAIHVDYPVSNKLRVFPVVKEPTGF